MQKQEHNDGKQMSEKKLKKRQRILEERLQKARVSQERTAQRLQLLTEKAQRKAVRVQCLEEKLASVQDQIKQRSPGEQNVPVISFPNLVSSSEPLHELDSATDYSREVSPLQQGVGAVSSKSSMAEDSQALAMEARKVAEIAEEAARLAIKRALEVETQLNRYGGGPHTQDELKLRQDQAARAQDFAMETGEAALETDILVKQLDESAAQDVPHQSDLEKLPAEMHASVNLNDGPETVADIECDEEMIESVAAMIIADSTTLAAEEAEVFAETASARANNARLLVEKAHDTLASVKSAIESGMLSGTDAEKALEAAENEVSRAQSVLTEAEAAEERARNEALNALAEADVTEGMAHSSEERWERVEGLRGEQDSFNKPPSIEHAEE